MVLIVSPIYCSLVLAIINTTDIRKLL